MRATQRLLPRAGQEVSFSPLKKKGSGGGGVKVRYAVDLIEL